MLHVPRWCQWYGRTTRCALRVARTYNKRCSHGTKYCSALLHRPWLELVHLLVAVVLAVIFSIVSTPVGFAQSEPEYNPGVLLLGVEQNASEDEIRQFLQNHGFYLDQYWPNFGLASARSATLQAAATIDDLQAAGTILEASDLIRYATPDQKVHSASRSGSSLPSTFAQNIIEPPLVEPNPNDQRFSDQYAFENMQVVEAWNLTKGSKGVVIGVIDSGYDESHSDIAHNQIWTNPAEFTGTIGVDDDNNGYIDDIHGWDWVEDDNVPNDPYGHGTHVSGAIIAASNNGIGVSGMAPNVRVASLRVLDQRGGGFISDLVSALAYAQAFDFPIVNLSLVIISDSPAIHDAVQAARATGIVIVAATGNVSSLVQWPAAYEETVAVAATDSNDQRASFSGQGPAVDVAAPGVSILSTYRNNTYAELSGTSMATSQVSALLALLLSLRPDLTADDLILILKNTADDVNSATLPGPDAEIGAGRINFYTALLVASQALDLSPASAAQPFIATGAETTYAVRVTAAGFVPVVSAKAFISPSLDSGQAMPRMQALTDNRGIVSVPITAPEQPGQYSFDMQVGAKLVSLPVTVYEAPMTLTLTISRTVLQAAEINIPFQINLFSASGSPHPGAVPIMLSTVLGDLGNGNQTAHVIVTGGEYANTFSAGRTAGEGELFASVGTLSDAVAFHVLPGPPAVLTGDDQFLPEVSDASTRKYRITFLVTDAYSNAVLDDTLVRVVTSEGKITPSELRTVNGEAVAQLALSTNVSTATITAEIPGTNVVKSVTISVPNRSVWLPLISSEQTTE